MRRRVHTRRLHARFSLVVCVCQKEEIKSIGGTLKAANFGPPVAITGVIWANLLLQLS